MSFAWQTAQAEGFSQESLEAVEASMGTFLHVWRAVLKWRPSYPKVGANLLPLLLLFYSSFLYVAHATQTLSSELAQDSTKLS